MRHTLCRIVLTVGAVTLMAACASGGGGAAASGGGCPLRRGDTVYVGGGPVYRDCAVDKKAVLTTAEVRPDFRPAAGGGSNRCYSVDLEFVVDATGAPDVRSARVVRTTDQAYADAWLATLTSLRYEPATRGGAPVRQIVNEHKTSAATSTPTGGRSSGRGGTRPTSC